MRCAECGAPAAEVTQACAECGAPPVWQWSEAADRVAAGRGAHRKTAPVVARGTWRPPAWIRRGQRYFMISLIFFLALYLIAVAGFNETVQSGLHHPLEWIIQLSVGAALLSVVLFEAARNQFRVRQLVWGLVPVLSLGVLAFAPFLWLALVRRRARGWAVFACYLAADATAIFLGNSQGAALEISSEIAAGLMVIGSLHAVLAFSPAAGPATFREAKAARAAGEPTGPVMDATVLEDSRQDAAG
jgi:hypothetical protein